MTESRLEQVARAYGRAVSLPANERMLVLREECGGDEELLEEVEELLRLGKPPRGFLGETAAMREALGATVPMESDGTPEAFRILAELGRGGMGIVYLAEQAVPRRLVALKKIRPDCANASVLARFSREIEALGRLAHPNIARIYEAGVTRTIGGSEPFICMELVQGRCITRYAKDWNLTVPDMLVLLARVCDALQYAHEKGIVHRDLKPANLLVVAPDGGDAAGGQPKVLDFGIARIAGTGPGTAELTLPGTPLGTLPYMSPEQLRGLGDAIDCRSDVYSLGAVGYEMLCGRPPFDLTGVGLPDAARVLCDVDPTPVESIHPDAAGAPSVVIRRAMEKKPAERFQSAAEFAAALRRAASPESRGSLAPTRRLKALGWIGGGGAVGGLLLLAFWLGLRNRSEGIPQGGGSSESQRKERLLESVAHTDISRPWQWIDARVALGELFLEEGLYDEALAYLSDALHEAARLAPSDARTARVRIRHGLALAEAGRVETAIELIELGIHQLQSAGLPGDEWVRRGSDALEALHRNHGNEGE